MKPTWVVATCFEISSECSGARELTTNAEIWARKNGLQNERERERESDRQEKKREREIKIKRETQRKRVKNQEILTVRKRGKEEEIVCEGERLAM